jgi:D-alanyl-D-alanine carboxypeptidase
MALAATCILPLTAGDERVVRHATRVAFTSLVAAVCLLLTACRATDTAAPRERARTLEAVLRDVRARYDLPALAAVVVRADGSTAIRAVGVRRAGFSTAVSADDRWHLGSNTKAFTATLVARLVERQALQWDTTVGRILGSILPVNAGYQAVTIEQLLSHAAGLPHDFPPNAAWTRAVAGEGSIRRQRIDLIAPILSERPLYVPGTRHAYSNVGFVVAGVMTEIVTGRTWEEQIVEAIAQPLGLETVGFGAPGRPDALDQPWGHRRGLLGLAAVPPGAAADNPPALGPEGTMHMSLADYARFLFENLEGERGRGRLLSGETYRRLHADDGRPAWGLGWGVRHLPVWGAVITHVGSNGRWYHLAWASLDREIGLALASNAPDGARTEAAFEEALQASLRLLAGDEPATVTGLR